MPSCFSNLSLLSQTTFKILSRLHASDWQPGNYAVTAISGQIISWFTVRLFVPLFTCGYEFMQEGNSKKKNQFSHLSLNSREAAKTVYFEEAMTQWLSQAGSYWTSELIETCLQATTTTTILSKQVSTENTTVNRWVGVLTRADKPVIDHLVHLIFS